MWPKIKSFLFRNGTTRQTVAKNTFWLTVSNIGGRLIRAALVIYAARVLGTAGWGVASYALTLSGFLTIFTDLGVNTTVTRESSRLSPERRKEVLAAAAFLKAAFAVVGVLIIVIAGPAVSTLKGADPLFPLVAATFVFDLFRDLSFSVIRGREKMEQEAGIFLFTNVGIAACGIVFLVIHPSAMSFILGYTVGTGLGTFPAAWAVRHDLKSIGASFSVRAVKTVLETAWPFAVAGLMGALLTNTDIIVIGWFRDASDVGLYSAAVRIIQLFYLIPGIIGLSTLPTFSRLAARADKNIARMVEETLTAAFFVSFPIAIGGIAVAGPLIGFIFGNAYLAGAAVFQILLLTMLLDYPAAILSNVVFAYNKQRTLAVYSVLGGVLNAALDLALIPKFGIEGSAAATLLAQAISAGYLWYVSQRLASFNVLPRLKAIAPAALTSAAAAWLAVAFGINVIVAVAAGAAAYFAVLALLKEPFLNLARLILRGDASGAQAPSGSAT